MSTDTSLPATTARAAGDPQISLRSKLFGLGSVFGKSIRDARRGFLLEVALLGGFLLVILAAIGRAYPTQAARDELARLATSLGAAAAGLAGPPVNVGTIGGYAQWKYGPIFLVAMAFWSIMSLTGTLAGEARRGSLDLVVSSSVSRRRVVAQKVAAHVTLVFGVALVSGLAAWLGGARFGVLPGDSIPPLAALGFALWIALMTLAFGGLAFAVSQFLGRSAAAWTAGVVLVVGLLCNGYRTVVPGFGPVADLTPVAWTADHIPLAGRYDWASLPGVAAMAVVTILIGIEAFVRRDLGAAHGIALPRLPMPAFGVRGPASRTFAQCLPTAVSWGLGLGAFGLVMAGVSRSLVDQFNRSPDLASTIRRVFPDFDLTSAGGFLQLMIQLLFVLAGFATVGLVSRWAGDESGGRLEIVLAAPLSRRSWVTRGAAGILAAIVVLTVITAAATGLGAAAAGSDAVTPMVGTVVLGLYAAALAGIGVAVAGLAGASAATAVVATVVVATYLIDLVVPALQLPGWVHQLALTSHLGQPMVGTWSVAGVLACVLIAVGGTALGVLGFTRRDLRT